MRKGNGAYVWLLVVLSFFLLNLNNGLAALLSFWVIYGLGWLLPKRKESDAKLSIWEQEQKERYKKQDMMTLQKNGFSRRKAQELYDQNKIEELQKYYDMHNNLIPLLKRHGMYLL